ncbi:MAG: serine--tRNA ligase [Candidatus Shapirobacteria bacterium]|nr:serine--tRNA ligase [Candidatus Shapirobacteria bacterium]
MIDINLIRQQPELVKQNLINRQRSPKLVDQILEIDKLRRSVLTQVEELRSQQNLLAKNFKGKPTDDQLKEATDLKGKLKVQETELKELEEKQNNILKELPNMVASDVPVGKDDSENVLFHEFSQPTKFDFKPLDHIDLGEKLDIIDVKRAAKVSGSRFGYFKGKGAVLEMAVMNFAFQKLIQKGFVGMIPPAMVKIESEEKMGYTSNKNLDNAYYSFPEDDLIFISSSEHSVVPYHMDEILDSKNLPIKYVNYSTCFRREAGTYGKDTRGVFRVHSFNKVEMNVFSTPDYKISDAMCLELLSIEEEIMQSLEIPYQVVKACTGDLPQPNRRMYDINSWFPGQDTFRETQSCSNCGDYQARRLNIKTKIEGKNEYVHILNATVITDRAVIAIIENHQQKDGSICIPKVLQPFTSFDIIETT